MRTTSGSVMGVSNGSATTFLGIPYAHAPTGAHRFADAVPEFDIPDHFNATKPGTICPQAATPFGNQQEMSEDCLNLNVTEPSGAYGLPVMVWVHGGANIGGSGVFANPTTLSTTGNGIVVVTINYRLGAFGWLASPALDPANTGRNGNWGLDDMTLALKWVKHNIAQFGGNPANVTIAGQSSGALSVCSLLGDPDATGLFNKAIVESGPCTNTFPTLAQNENAGATFVANLGCSGTNAQILQCLQSASITSIINAQGALGVPLPAEGTLEIPNQPRGSIGTVPMILGGTSEEGALFAENGAAFGLPFPVPITAAAYPQIVGGLYGSQANAVLNQYPLANFASPTAALGQVLTDFNPAIFISYCDDVTAFELSAKTANNVFAYEFADPNAPVTLNIPGLLPGPVHASELQYLFDPSQFPTADGLNPALPAASQALAAQMKAYWSSFVTRGNTHTPGQNKWPQFQTDTDVIQFVPGDVDFGTVNVRTEHQCNFWNSLGDAT